MRTREALRQVVRLTNDAVMITAAHPLDEPGPAIVYVNEAFERLTGYGVGEALGRSPRFLQDPGTDPEARRRIRRALEEQEPV
ncbi:PAS domain-containing protein, partial [Arenibaculum sp.]|uniref:PAS domain-containing protein n=1 Tax=Arenibaculum sp. TaxID=2865862 RepID=UPI002E11DF3F|nr:PAS domain-containing protein [Arenibaculum sp.]